MDEPQTTPNPNQQTKKFNRVNLAHALKLRQKGVTYQEIGQLQGVHPTSVLRGLQRLLPTESTKVFVEHRPEIYDELDRKIIMSMTAKAGDKKASVNNLAYAHRQIFDSMRVLRGQPTSINFIAMAQIVQDLRAERDKE